MVVAQPLDARPVQVVVDCVGGYAGSACRGLLGPGGRHIRIAAETLGETPNILVPPFRSRSVLGRANTARLQAVVAAVASGAVKVHVAETMPLLAAERALALSQAGRMTGKIVLVP